ncbi:hypothetical protein CBL_00011 [Carabus blaptoides fortunei]
MVEWNTDRNFSNWPTHSRHYKTCVTRVGNYANELESVMCDKRLCVDTFVCIRTLMGQVCGVFHLYWRTGTYTRTPHRYANTRFQLQVGGSYGTTILYHSSTYLYTPTAAPITLLANWSS